MKNIKKSINELKGKFLGGQYEKFLIGNKKDFLLIIKDIMQENGKLSKEADELLNHHIASMRKFCEKNYVQDKDDFIEGIIETNFIDGIDDITADIMEDDIVEFHKFKDKMKEYEKAKNIIRERAGLEPLERVIDVLLAMGIPLVPKEEKDNDSINIPSFYELFYFRTYICDKLLENMEKIHNIGTPKTPLEEIELAKCKDNIDRIIANKNKNIVDYTKEMDDYILENNLVFDRLNKTNYHLTIIMDKKEFNKNPFKIFLTFTTPNVQIEESEKNYDYMIVNLNCRNKAEVYALFRGFKELKIKIHQCSINEYNNDYERDTWRSHGALLKEDTIYESVNDYSFDLDKLIRDNEEENFIQMIDGKKEIVNTTGIKDCLKTVVKNRFRDTDYEDKFTDFEAAQLGSFLYTIMEYDYKRYTLLYTYLLLNIDNIIVENFLLQNVDDERKPYSLLDIVNYVKAKGKDEEDENELFTKEINAKLKELVDNKNYEILYSVISIVESSFIAFTTVDYIYDKMANEINL